MSHIFDTLRRLEGERGGIDSRVPSEAVDLLGLAEAKFPPKSEVAFRPPTNEVPRATPVQEPRLRVVGSPLSVGGWTPASHPSPAVEVPAPPAPVTAAPSPAFASAVFNTPVFNTPSFASPVFARPSQESPSKIHEDVAAPIRQEISFARPAEESKLRLQQEVTASIQREESPAGSAEVPSIKLPAGVQRVVSTLRALLPYVERILPLFDGNFGTAVSNLINPQAPAPQLPPPVDLVPFDDSLAELKTQFHELREEAIERDASLQRIGDELDMVRESTDRNTLQQQELHEDLKGLGNKVSFVTMVALGLLAVSVVINTLLYLHIVKILR
jgi:hypothetical protein